MRIIVLKRIFTRPFPLAVVDGWDKGLIWARRILGAAMTHDVFYGHDGCVECFRSDAEIKRVQRKYLSLLRTEPTVLITELRVYLRGYNRMRKILNQLSFIRSKQKLAEATKEFSWLFSRCFPGLFASVWLTQALKESRLTTRYAAAYRLLFYTRTRRGEWGAVGATFYEKLSAKIHGFEPLAELYTAKELFALLKNDFKLPQRTLRARMRGYWMYHSRLSPISSRTSLDRILSSRGLKIVEDTAVTKNEIRGMPAYPGKVRGRVVVVRSIADCSDVRRGNVLVSPMTYPTFLQAMQRAAAFVTDEGGNYATPPSSRANCTNPALSERNMRHRY